MINFYLAGSLYARVEICGAFGLLKESAMVGLRVGLVT
jgi:hypothetical protein